MFLEHGRICLCSPWLIISYLGFQFREDYTNALGEYAHSSGYLSCEVFSSTVTIKWVKGERDGLLRACLKVRSVQETADGK